MIFQLVAKPSLYICDIPSCGKTFSSYSSYHKHKQTHDQSITYTCNYPNCNKVYKTRQVLNVTINNEIGIEISYIREA